MQYDLTGFSRRDSKLIRDNENKTPAELVDLGLSNKAYGKLVEQLERSITAPKQEVTAKPQEDKPAKADNKPKPLQPTVIDHNVSTNRSAGDTPKQLSVRGPSGNVVKMAYAAAMRLATNSPNQYTIVE